MRTIPFVYLSETTPVSKTNSMRYGPRVQLPCTTNAFINMRIVIYCRLVSTGPETTETAGNRERRSSADGEISPPRNLTGAIVHSLVYSCAFLRGRTLSCLSPRSATVLEVDFYDDSTYLPRRFTRRTNAREREEPVAK